MKIFIPIILLLIIISGLSCSRNEDTFKEYTVAGEKTGIDTTAPLVVSTSPSNGANIIDPEITSISVTFSEMMETATITVNNSDTICSGSLQLSGDDFS